MNSTASGSGRESSATDSYGGRLTGKACGWCSARMRCQVTVAVGGAAGRVLLGCQVPATAQPGFNREDAGRGQ